MGFFLYATYELSNLAVLRRWTYSLAAMDIAWGTFMCGLTGLVQHLLASALAKAEGLDD